MQEDAQKIIGIYRRHGLTWAKARRTDLMERGWLAAFAAHLPGHGAVLDLGCGMGVPMARHLARAGYAVTGVDSSAPLLAQARKAVPEARFILADMRGLALGQRFDGILAWNSFFHLAPQDQEAMFAVFAAHARPGAALMFTSGPAEGEAMGRLEGEALYHYSFAPAQYRALLEAHGFEEISFVAEDPDCGNHSVWLARRRG